MTHNPSELDKWIKLAEEAIADAQEWKRKFRELECKEDDIPCEHMEHACCNGPECNCSQHQLRRANARVVDPYIFMD